MAEEEIICEICGENPADFINHYERHLNPPRSVDICRSCHRSIHGKFKVRMEVWLPTEMAEFLENMVQKGVAESLSQALRKCVAVAKTYMPEVTVEIEEEK